MARVFITGAADGLGQMAARLMVGAGHRVVLHARHEARAKQALAAVPGAETVVSGDLSSVAECRLIAARVNALGDFDAVIHNAERLVYLSSGLHRSGDASLQDLTWSTRPWSGFNAYADSKLHDVILA